MRIGDDARKCVIYLGQKKDGQDHELDKDKTATAFFISHKVDGVTTWYLITNKHVATTIGVPPFFIRFNKKGLEDSWLEPIREAKWERHDDDAVDLALMEFNPPKDADVLAFPAEHLLTQEKIIAKQIGAGDITYVIGLFKRLPGTKRCMPIVHTGHLALAQFGSERIPLKNQYGVRTEIQAHLVQAHTLSGSSGSPVFIKRGIEVWPAEDTGVMPRAFGAVFLLGVWQGSFEAKPGETLVSDAGFNANDRLAVGYGVVVPAHQILEILLKPELQQARRATEQNTKLTMNASVPDALSAPTVTTDVSLSATPLRFEEMLRFVEELRKRNGN